MLVAIEGIDGSGKGTQAALLRDRVAATGRSVELFSFPRYSQTRFGKLIGDFLNGRFGSLEDVSPFLASLLYSGDRFESAGVLREAMEQNDVVICDRFVASNVAHQGAKLMGREREELIEWVHHLEHEIYNLPRPDVVVLLSLTATRAQELIAKKSQRDYTDKAADLQEADVEYLHQVAELYRDLANRNDAWRTVDVERDNVLRSIDEVAADVFAAVNLR